MEGRIPGGKAAALPRWKPDPKAWLPGLDRTIERQGPEDGAEGPSFDHFNEPCLLKEGGKHARDIVPGILDAVEKLNAHK